MNDKSTYNMVVSIINAALSLLLLALVIVFQAIKKNTLGIIFMSIIYSIMLSSHIFKSIFYAKKDSLSKKVLHKLSLVTTTTYISLMAIYFLLKTESSIKWIIIGIIISILIIGVVFDSINKFKEIKYLLLFITYLVLIFTFYNIYRTNTLFYLLLLSIIIESSSNLLGNLLKNKTILSFEIISVVLYGIIFVLM